jgi:hypothetical protein
MKYIPLIIIPFLASCSGLVDSYTVDGTGLDWTVKGVQTLPPERVTPNIRVPLPNQVGGGHVVVPIVVLPTK